MRKTYLMRCMLIVVILMLLLALVSCGLTSNKTRKNSNNTNTPENNENSNSENGNGENGGNNSGSNGGNENLTPSEELLNIIKSFEYYIDIFGTKKRRIIKDGIVGQKYMMILKHNSNKNFSARSA